MSDLRTMMVYSEFSVAARELIRLSGGEPPERHELQVQNVEIDTEKKALRIVYDFIPLPEPIEKDVCPECGREYEEGTDV